MEFAKWNFLLSLVAPAEFALLFLIQFHYLHLYLFLLHAKRAPDETLRSWIFLSKRKEESRGSW